MSGDFLIGMGVGILTTLGYVAMLGWGRRRKHEETHVQRGRWSAWG